jgi:hypothetical protein
MSLVIDVGVMAYTFPTMSTDCGALIEFGAVTINPEYTLQSGIFTRTEADGKQVHLIKVFQWDFTKQEVAFSGISMRTATELISLLCRVVHGSITRQTYERELPLCQV